MKTPFGVAAAIVLLAAPGRAATTAAPAATVDPMKWNAETERNSVNDWFTVTIAGEKYLAYKPSAAEKKSGKYPPKDKGYAWATPLFHYKPDDAKTGRLTPLPDASFLLLEFPAKTTPGAKGAKPLEPKVVCIDASCRSVDVAHAKILKLADDKSSGFPAATKDSKVVVTPPAATTTPSTTGTDKNADTTPAFGDWENAASATIAAPDDNDKKNDKTNDDRRKSLTRHLQAYLEGTKDKKTGLDTNEIEFVKRELTRRQDADLLAGFEDAAKANKDGSNPASAAFISRWRKFVADDVNGYLANGTTKNGYQGSSAAVSDLSKDIRANGAGAGSELEVKLAKAHPGEGRMAAAQRKIVAAYIKAHLKTPPDPKDPDQAKMRAALDGDAKAYDSIWKRITRNGNLLDAVNGKDRGIDLGKIVDRETLLDAYCDPSKFHGGAAPPKSPSAMGQARDAKTDATTAATSANSDQTGSGGGTMDGTGTAAVAANDPCAGRINQLNGLVKELPANGTPNLRVDGNAPPSPDARNNTGTDQTSGDKFAKHESGPNQGPQTDPGDPKFGDHMRSGFSVGGFLGLLGLFMGGPVGLLVLGGAGFALGFGIDKLTNKGKS